MGSASNVLHACICTATNSGISNCLSHSSPKPSAFCTAWINFSFIVFLLLYAGKTNMLKQVWDIGSLKKIKINTVISVLQLWIKLSFFLSGLRNMNWSTWTNLWHKHLFKTVYKELKLNSAQIQKIWPNLPYIYLQKWDTYIFWRLKKKLM